MTSKLEKILNNLPTRPGVYLHKDEKGEVLYVGKAKNLKKRVQSYFRKSNNLDEWKQRMVEKIRDIETIIVNTEEESLVLESNLIKKFRPQYNVMFKDDKAYKFIKIDYSEDFPKIYTTRKIDQDGSRYFGPFTNGFAVVQTLQLLRKIFPYRTCNVDMKLTEGKDSEKFITRPCLYYHIKRCDAPCVGFVSRTEYMKNIKACERFLSGETESIIEELRESMDAASEEQEYEKAAKFRDQIQDINRVIDRQQIVSPRKTSYDIIHLAKNKSEAYINLFLVRDGKLIGRENITVVFPAGAQDTEILSSFVSEHYQKAMNFPKSIIVPEALFEQESLERIVSKRARERGVKHAVTIEVPQKGDKKKLLAMARDNALEYKKREQLLSGKVHEDTNQALMAIAKAAGLKKPPKRIEIYDMSNTQGTSAVGSMVVFTNGKPDKKSYRRFRIKTLSTPNDVGMMTEVLVRRLKKLGEQDTKERERWPMPDLIVLDGGKPQHKAAREAFAITNTKLPFISLAKREEEVFVPGKSQSVRFARDSQELFLMQRMRDEAHRFAITYHRNLRGKKAYRSALDDVPGLGPKKKKALLQTIGPLAKIKASSETELARVVGKKVAHNIKVILG